MLEIVVEKVNPESAVKTAERICINLKRRLGIYSKIYGKEYAHLVAAVLRELVERGYLAPHHKWDVGSEAHDDD